MEILAVALTDVLDKVMNILYVAVGIGLVIFFHELGHFAVAKWCDVHVERFSIGFGPILWSRKKGETEYALSAIPFGGYVKMLGQDDMDPSQLSSEQIAEDPRSYSSKSVWKRMSIISAGVIMNVLTAVLFFALAFQLGVESPPAIVGGVQSGMPAWRSGIQLGDRITRMNGRNADSFEDIMIGSALSSGNVTIEGVHRDGKTFAVTLKPDTTGKRRMIGVGPINSLELIDPKDKSIPPVVAGTPAADAKPAFQHGDVIRKVDDRELAGFADLQRILADRRAETIEFTVARKDREDTVGIAVGPQPFRILGLSMDIGQIAAIIDDSPADAAGLKAGDKISKVNGREVGTDLNPLVLPDLFAELHGKNVAVEVVREGGGGPRETITVNLVPLDRPGWIERPDGPNVPVSVPAIGVAFHMNSAVLKVEPGSPAAEAGIRVASQLKKFELVLPKGAKADGNSDKDLVFEAGKDSAGAARNWWGCGFWMLQLATQRIARLTFDDPDGKEKIVELTPAFSTDWFLPMRGMRLVPLFEEVRADSFVDAMSMGLHRSRNTMAQIYLTLQSLFSRRLSVKELHGPIGIAGFAYQLVQQGIAALLLFLGILSINLAVLNFLPIPVLDGGHMVFLIWEAVTRKKPSERVLVAATYCGMAFVLGLMLFVIYLDLFEHLKVFG